MEAGQLRLNMEAVDMRALLQQVAQRWTPRALDQDIELVVRASDARMDGDVARLRVVFDNLLSNALKYTPRGGQIRVDAAPVERGAGHRSVRVAVVDTGPGVPEAYRSCVFRPDPGTDSDVTRPLIPERPDRRFRTTRPPVPG
jgi:signal transduction histidine kinase